MLDTLGACDIGAALVGATLNAEWAQRLTHLERVVLITMAHTALDPGQANGRAPGEYWAGIGNLITSALGKAPDDLGPIEYASAKRVILRAVARLEAVHAIEQVKAGHRGQQARWKVVLDLSQPVDNAPGAGRMGDTSVPLKVTPVSPISRERVTPVSAKGDTRVTLRMYED